MSVRLQKKNKNIQNTSKQKSLHFDPVQAAFDDLWHSLASFRRAKQSVAAVDAHLKTAICRILPLKEGWKNTSKMGRGEGKHSASFWRFLGFCGHLWKVIHWYTLNWAGVKLLTRRKILNRCTTRRSKSYSSQHIKAWTFGIWLDSVIVC